MLKTLIGLLSRINGIENAFYQGLNFVFKGLQIKLSSMIRISLVIELLRDLTEICK